MDRREAGGEILGVPLSRTPHFKKARDSKGLIIFFQYIGPTERTCETQTINPNMHVITIRLVRDNIEPTMFQ
eukprot:scaffold71702_cov25-Cyclotella_meneghiniana.AAC.4